VFNLHNHSSVVGQHIIITKLYCKLTHKNIVKILNKNLRQVTAGVVFIVFATIAVEMIFATILY